MAGHTVPIDFRVNPAKISNPVERKTLLQDLLPVVEPFTGTLTEVSVCEVPGGNYVALYASDKMTFSVKLYGNGVVTASVEYYTDEVNEHKIVNDTDGRRLERQLREKFGCTVAKVLPALKRAPLINPYFTSSDDRILEYDVDKLIFEKQSDFQKVQILHTLSFGNILLLDDLQNLAESDLPYTHGLMNKENEDFEGKEILILGGGDGALLWELLKEKPKFVTMIDIDNVVMEACRKHMRSVCGDCMDNYEGSNYKKSVLCSVRSCGTRFVDGAGLEFCFRHAPCSVNFKYKPFESGYEVCMLLFNLLSKPDFTNRKPIGSPLLLWFRKLVRRKDDHKVGGPIWDDQNKYLLIVVEQYELTNQILVWLDNSQRKFLCHYGDTTSTDSLHCNTSMPQDQHGLRGSGTYGVQGESVVVSFGPVNPNVPIGTGFKSGAAALAGNREQLESDGDSHRTLVRVPRFLAGVKFSASVPALSRQLASASTVRSSSSHSHSSVRPPVPSPVVVDRQVPALTWEDVRLLNLENTVMMAKVMMMYCTV